MTTVLLAEHPLASTTEIPQEPGTKFAAVLDVMDDGVHKQETGFTPPFVKLTLADPELELQKASVELTDNCISSGSAIAVDIENEQLLLSETITEQLPGHKLSALLVVCKFGSFHWQLYGGVPEEAVTVAIPSQSP